MVKKLLCQTKMENFVAELGVEPSLRDYEPHVHRTLPRASRN